MIDKRKLWKTVLVSWGFTLMGLFNIAVLCLVVAFIALRVRGPAAVVAVLMPTLALMILTFLAGEVIVNLIFRAETPHPERDKRFLDALSSASRQAGMWVRPRPWILSLGGMPNAMAYGPGLPWLAAVGVSRELVEMLSQDELDGVLAHEVAHIRCRDTGILAVIGLILGMIERLRTAIAARQSLWLQSPVVLALAWLIYGIGKVAFLVSRFSISQERELAADALGASYLGTPHPLINALRKLERQIAARGDGGQEPLFKDLMAAHPGMRERIRSLEAITRN